MLVFNGGHVKNGKIVANDTKYCSRNVHLDCFDCEIEGVMERIGYVETASSVGMIKDSEIHARDYFNICVLWLLMVEIYFWTVSTM